METELTHDLNTDTPEVLLSVEAVGSAAVAAVSGREDVNALAELLEELAWEIRKLV